MSPVACDVPRSADCRTARQPARLVDSGFGLLTAGLLLQVSGVVLEEMLGAAQPVPRLVCLGIIAVMVDAELSRQSMACRGIAGDRW